MAIYALWGLATLAMVVLDRIRPVGLLFFVFVVWFVTLRFETGFDWPVYKGLFNEMRLGFSAFQLSKYASAYNGEPAFLLLLGALSFIFSKYEFAQLLFSVFFLASLFALGATFSKDKVYVFIAIALSYILLTVGFSTVRQSIAIAFFNFALIFYYKGAKALVLPALALAVLFQYSAAIYVGAFLILLISWRFDFSRNAGRTFIFVFFFVSLVLGGAVFLSLLGFMNGDPRIAFYVDAMKYYKFGLWDLMFVVVFISVASHVMISNTYNKSLGRGEAMISRLVVILAAISIATVLIPIVRERVSYQLWILYALFLTFRYPILRKTASIAGAAFGLFFSYLGPLSYPNNLMFVPYRNYSGVEQPEGTSSRPYDEFMREHMRLMSQSGG